MADLNHDILNIIACPICKGKLDYDKNHRGLICKFDKLEFPIKDGVPIMLEKDAKPFSESK